MAIPSLTPLSTPPGRTANSFDDVMPQTLNEIDNMVDEMNATIAGINVLVPTLESVPEKSAAATQAAADAAASRDAAAGSAALSAAAASAADGFAAQAGAAKTDTLAARDQAVAAAAVLNVASAPAHYARDILGGIAGYSVAADRRTLLTPNKITCNINDSGFYLAGQQRLDLNLAASWDSTTPDYTVPANRAGKDFYRYAVNDNGTIRILCSANATYPAGFTASNSRKLGGFHCVPLSYGAISGHTLTGFITGDIIPGTVWDLMHLPRCAPEGMTWDAGTRLWADLYGNSWSGGKLVSVYNATMVDGVSAPAFHWLKAAQYLAAIGKRMFWQHEFLYLALGCNEGTNIAGSADPGVAGAFTDTAGRRMVSNNGCEGMAGIMWWWAIDTASYGSAAWKNGFDANDAGVGGQMYYEPNRALVGGYWANAANCGSRALNAGSGPLALAAAIGVRGVAEPLAI